MIYIFDLDGTLTLPRQAISSNFVDKFNIFLKKNDGYIVSGADYNKIKEQVPKETLGYFKGIFSSMGNEFYIGNDLIYSSDFIPDQALLTDLQYFRDNTKYPGQLFDNYIELRRGMINFSTLGRNGGTGSRIMYNNWDNEKKERKHICDYLTKKYKEYDISIGGEISIDIIPKGKSKEQAFVYLRKLYPSDELVFFGDKIQKGGNDYSIAQACYQDAKAKVIEIQGPKQLFEILKF